MLRVELLCFGMELLVNKINSNVPLIADRLENIGLSLARVVTVGDVPREIEKAFQESVQQSDIVLTCGGLGPTFDDLTRDCLSKVLKKPLQFKKEILEQIKERFRISRLKMAAENRSQAYLLKGAIPILNNVGTAPGQIIPLGKKCVIALPGPPRELLPMLEGAVLDYIKQNYPTGFKSKTILHVFGKPESEIDEKIAPVIKKNWNKKGLNVNFEILAHNSIIDVCVFIEGKRKEDVEAHHLKIKQALRKVLGKDYFGENEDTLESVVGARLSARKETLSLAESCTGGLLADKITNISGSSNYFKEGVVVYSNESKMRLLGVKKETLDRCGAVSEAAAQEMAAGVLKRSKSDWALSITGIAGPAGGTPDKSVGTVWFAIAHQKKIKTILCHFTGNRHEIKEKSALTALNLLRVNL